MSLKSRARCCALAAVLTGALTTTTTSGARAPRPGVDWPQFRGIRAQGVADGFVMPAHWNVEGRRGIAWKTPIPGLGLSSPIVWGDLVCLSTSISGKPDASLRIGLYGDIDSVPDNTDHAWRVYCLDKRSGAIKWQQTAHKGIPKIKRHLKATHANSTLATDGERLIALFGSEGLYAYDLDGKLIWKKDLGVLDAGYYEVPDAQWETGSSPVIEDDTVIIQADVQKGSFLAAFDARHGRQLWRVERRDVPTWSTPTIHEVGGVKQIIVNGWRHAGAYDFKTGKEIWNLKSGGDIPVPTPVVHGGLVFLTSAHGAGSPVYAIRETATGDISAVGDARNAAVSWSYPRDGSYMATPVVYRGVLYVVRWNGLVNAYDAKTGEKKFQQRLGDGKSAFTSSPIAADGKVYVANEDGRVFVITASSRFQLLSENDMGESVLASPAASEGYLLYRTQSQLVAIAATQSR